MDRAGIGLPLGVEPQEHYQTVNWQIHPGERLLLFTDGIIEATNRDGKLFGLARLRNALAELTPVFLSSEALLDALVDRVKDFMDGSDFEDDFTLLAIERR